MKSRRAVALILSIRPCQRPGCLNLGWNEKYLQAGCGGLCGTISFQYTTMTDLLRRGYATAATEDGHEAPVTDASWALGQPGRVGRWR